MPSQPPAIVLLSGGIDSAVALAVARHEGLSCIALTFRYGQRHSVEIDCARRVASSLSAIDHVFVDIDLRQFGGSALTADIPVPQGQSARSGEIPVTYVPARNTIFLAHALALAEVRDAYDIFIGVNAVDYSNYPDCRPEFIAAFEGVARLATRTGVQGRPIRIRAPLIGMTKPQIIQRGQELGVDFGMTHSCYAPVDDGQPCGQCDACRIRMGGFVALGMSDPALVDN